MFRWTVFSTFNSKLFRVQHSYTIITPTELDSHSSLFYRGNRHEPFERFSTFRRELIATGSVGRSENRGRLLFLQNTCRAYRFHPTVVPLKRERINVPRTCTCVHRQQQVGAQNQFCPRAADPKSCVLADSHGDICVCCVRADNGRKRKKIT